jgi:hypothetical protein
MTYQILSEAQLRFEAMTSTRDRVHSTTARAARSNRRSLRRRQG